MDPNNNRGRYRRNVWGGNNRERYMRPYCECCGEWLPERIPMAESTTSLARRRAINYNYNYSTPPVYNPQYPATYIPQNQLNPTPLYRPYLSTQFNNEGSIDNIFTRLFGGIYDITDFLNTRELVTLNDEQFSQIPTRAPTNDDVCSVCQLAYETAVTSIKEVRCCRKTYHFDCLKNWLCNQSVTCPTCRADQRSYLTTGSTNTNTTL